MHLRFNGQLDSQSRTVCKLNLYGCRQHERIAIFNRYLCTILRISANVIYACNSKVQCPVIKVPTSPKPTQIFASLAFHGSKKVRGLRVFVSPRPNEMAEGPIEALWAQDLLTQQDQPKCRLEIGNGMAVFVAD